MKDVIKTIITESIERKNYSIIKRELDVPVDTKMIISFIGARRSGKTYLLYQVINKLINSGINRKNILFLNFEDERIVLDNKNLDLILQAYRELFPGVNLSDVYFLFDEIQNITGWEKFVRRIFDNYSKKIFVTGSNSKLLSTEIATSLRGRTITYTVYPLNFKEYLKFNKVEINLFNPDLKAELINNSKDFIMNGGFPELFFLNNEVKTKVLQSNFNTMIFRDIIERYNISDITILKYFIKKIYANIGNVLSVNKIYNDLKSMGYKISNKYLYVYSEYIFATFMALYAKKYDYSEIKQEKADKKVYSIDTGLVSSVEYSISENRGKLLENAVFTELLKKQYSVYYYKDYYECDFIAEKSNSKTAIQVSWDISNKDTLNRELRGLQNASKKLNINKKVIITYDTKKEIQFNGNKYKAIPFYEYFLD